MLSTVVYARRNVVSKLRDQYGGDEEIYPSNEKELVRKFISVVKVR